MIKKTSYLLFVAALAFSCKKDDVEPTPVTPPVTNPPTTQNTEHITASIDGNSWSAVQLINGCGLGLSQSAQLDSQNNLLHLDYSAGFTQDANISPITSTLVGDLSVGVSGYDYIWSDYDNALFHSSIASVSENYYVEGSATPGPEVTYYINDELWSTKFGSQAGSTFDFTTNQSVAANGWNDEQQKLKGTFSCKVYNENSPSQFKTITSGDFFIYVEKY